MIAAACSSTSEALKRANPPLEDLDDLRPGKVISLPVGARGLTARRALAPLRETFPVRSSTNVAAVAARLDVSRLAVEQAKPHLGSSEHIPVGTLLNVPPAL